MRPAILFCIFFLFCFYAAPVAILAQSEKNGIKEIGAVEMDILLSSYTEKEFIPQIDQNLYIWTENSWQLRSRFNWHGSNFSIAWQETSIEQKNELFNDLDFSIKSQGPVFGVAYPLTSKISGTAKLALEKYEDTSKNVFYSLENSTNSSEDLFYFGLLQATYSGKQTWTSLSYNRLRDTAPLYDPITNRAELSIRARELSGISTGWLFFPEWEVGGSVFFEKYATGTPDQFNINSQLTYRPQKIKQLDLSLGAGYYTEEEETIVNFAATYLVKWRLLDLYVQYQLESSANEQSLLHEGTVSLRYYLNEKISLSIEGDYGQETGDDEDSASSLLANLNFLF